MNRRLAKAVIATLGNNDQPATALMSFSPGDWERTYGWLDASGLALYLLNRLESTGMANGLPDSVRNRLDGNRSDNRARTKELFIEFTRINRAFQHIGMRYACLKGFSLAPDYCSDPSLRCQLDFDFLIQPCDVPRCSEALALLGYQLTHANENDWEFRTVADRPPSLRDLYKPKPQRSLELHFGIGHSRHTQTLTDDLLSRLQQRRLYGITFPSLSPADMFLGQALHLLRHLCCEWTRISWLLEYRNFVRSQSDNHALWNEVYTRSASVDDCTLAIGAATHMASMAFGEFAPPALTEWSVRSLPDSVRLWIERYGRDVLLADFPGTKLYLLLQRELMSDEQGWRQLRSTKLFPLHRTVPLVCGDDKSKDLGARQFVSQLRFSVFRLRFHLIEGLRYLFESWRWKRILRPQQ